MIEHCTTDRASSDLLQPQSWPTLTLRRGEPVVNAREFCKYRLRPLVYWRGDFFEWIGTYYRQISADAVTAEVYSFLDCAQVRVPGKEEGYSVEFFDMTGRTVAVVTLPGGYLRAPTAADRPSTRTLSGSVA